MRVVGGIILVMLSTAVGAQIIEVTGFHERGKFKDGRSVGIWNYYDADNNLQLSINFDRSEIEWFEPDSAEYMTSVDGVHWNRSKVSRPPIFPGNFFYYFSLGESNRKIYFTKSHLTVLQFEIDENGAIGYPDVIDPVSEPHRAAIIKFYESLPKQWAAAMVNKKFVKSRISIGFAYCNDDCDDVIKPWNEQGKDHDKLWAIESVVNHNRGLKTGFGLNLREYEYNIRQLFWSPDDSKIMLKSYDNSVLSGPRIHYAELIDSVGSKIKSFYSTDPFVVNCKTRDCQEIWMNFENYKHQSRSMVYKVSSGEQVLFSEQSDYLPITSPNQEYIAYQSNQTGKSMAYVKAYDQAPTPIELQENIRQTFWLDDDNLVFESGSWPDTELTLYNIKSKQTRDVPGNRLNDFVELSPDGRYMLVRKLDNFGDSKLMVIDRTTLQSNKAFKWEISVASAAWSRDGQTVFYQADNNLYAFDVSTRKKKLILKDVISTRLNHQKTKFVFINKLDGKIYTCNPEGQEINLIFSPPTYKVN